MTIVYPVSRNYLELLRHTPGLVILDMHTWCDAKQVCLSWYFDIISLKVTAVLFLLQTGNTMLMTGVFRCQATMKPAILVCTLNVD